jgi:hypothetical protein
MSEYRGIELKEEIFRTSVPGAQKTVRYVAVVNGNLMRANSLEEIQQRIDQALGSDDELSKPSK